MWKQILLGVVAITFAFSVLLISVFRTASVKHDFGPSSASPLVLGDEDIFIDYALPYPGSVLPDSPLWPIKAMRDKLWLFANTNPNREAELKLLFADKRLGAAKLLFEKGKAEDAYSTLTKAEKYLEDALRQEELNRERGVDTKGFMRTIAKASLKHYGTIQEVLSFAPDDARPGILGVQSYSKATFEKARNTLLDDGEVPPINPFDWD